MKKLSKWMPAAILLAGLAYIPPAFAQNTPEGIEVSKPSVIGQLVPQEAIEQEAEKQYSALKTEAQKKRALVSPSDPRVVRLRAIANRIIPHTGRWNNRAPQWNWEVNLFSSKQVNAFCMPGGKIAFFTGILDSLHLTDDEAAIVMGHEIAHALREHTREQAATGTLLDLGIRLGAQIFDLGTIGQALLGGGSQLAMMKFSRDDESEADIVGLDIVARAGYDPRAGIAMWQKMALLNQSAPPEWLSTHPAGQNRIAEMQRYMPKVLPLYARTRNLPVDALPPYQSNVKGIAAIP